MAKKTGALPSMIYNCRLCGKLVDLKSFDMKRTRTREMGIGELCFDCVFWNAIKNMSIPNMHVISGEAAIFEPLFGKADRRVLKSNDTLYAVNQTTMEPVRIKEFKSVCKVPYGLSKKIVDEYRFISKDTYMKMNDRQSDVCMMRGCFDRYNCLWYNKNKAEPNGAYNKIPDTYKVGSELCESFINKDKMYDV